MEIAFIILCLFIVGYIIVTWYLYKYRNPSWDSDESLTSTVTYSSLGMRGDLGNQIFELATTFAASQRSNAKMVVPSKIDTLPINKLFDLSSWERKDIKPDASYYEYDNYELINIPKTGLNYDIRGYRQAYKYFEDYQSEIRKIFTPRSEILDKIRRVVPKKYLAIHIRRGDYFGSMDSFSICRGFKKCQGRYYQAGIDLLLKIDPKLPILVCTDSPRLVEPLLKSIHPRAQLAPTIPDISPKLADFGILYLADGLVISNSTYSWWAAYLRKERPVVCPTPWWDPDGFVGTGIGLNQSQLFYYPWWILDANTGEIKRTSLELDTNEDISNDCLNVYRMLRGMFI